MKSATWGYVLRLSLTLLVITALVAGALAGVNAITAGPIAETKAEKTRQAVAQVLPGAAEVAELSVDPEDSVAAVYTAQVPDKGLCYAVEIRTAGFGGTIDMMVGADPEGKVLGIAIISHSETPGLGAVAAAGNAAGQRFRQQFIGLSGALHVTKDGGSVDAITGATVTSRAVTQGVNLALEWIARNGQGG